MTVMADAYVSPWNNDASVRAESSHRRVAEGDAEANLWSEMVPPAGFEPATPALGEFSSRRACLSIRGFSGAVLPMTGTTGCGRHQFAPRTAPRWQRKAHPLIQTEKVCDLGSR